MGHSHAHVPSRRRLLMVLALTLVVMVVEALVAWTSGSLALLADAGHMLTDAAAIILALAAMTVARIDVGPGSRQTFGWARVEVLAAGANALGLLGLCAFIAWHAIARLRTPTDVDAGWALVAAAVGLVANLAGMWLLNRDAGESLNLRGAFLEVTADALGSLAVLVSSVVILTTGWHRADAVASLLIAAFVVPRSLMLLREVAEVLLEATPRHVDLDELRQHILQTPGVLEVHDLHVWTITSALPVMSAHVVVDDDVTEMGQAHAVLERLRSCLADHFDVEHSTFQIEGTGHADSEPHVHR
ncbi:MAG: cation diffusion facilitator family transporter [Aeromicrobium sp.]